MQTLIHPNCEELRELYLGVCGGLCVGVWPVWECEADSKQRECLLCRILVIDVSTAGVCSGKRLLFSAQTTETHQHAYIHTHVLEY